MRLDHTLPGVMTQSSGLDTPTSNFLPQRVVDVPKEVIRAFPHSKRVGNYLLGKTLGEGSFAKVKQALHTSTGEKVAIKVIDKKKAKEDVYVRKNLRREGKLLQMVRHKHVIQLLEIMETENSYYLVTELCQGGDLMDLICSNKRLDETQTRKYIKQIISAIDYLHKAGILHRDLKVENLLLDNNKDIKIIDFGLSNSVKVFHTKDGGSQAQEYCVTQCGSPAYAAPELLGNKKYGPKVDIWSIGVNMYAMLTGNLPFTVEPFNIKALHNKMLNGDMNAIPETLSSDCVDLLKKLLTASPESRITLTAAMQHPWITQGNNKPMDPAPFPNRLSSDYLDHDIIKHMSTNMDYRMSEVIRLVTNNIPNNATSTYHMLLRKLTRYNEQIKAKGRSTSESRHATPNNSKTFPRRSVTGDMIKLTPVDKSNPKTARRAASQDVLMKRQRTNMTDDSSKPQSPRNMKKANDEESNDGEKTLVRRRIQNARVLHQIHNETESNKKPSSAEKKSVLRADHIPIKSNCTEDEEDNDNDDAGDDNAEQVDEDDHDRNDLDESDGNNLFKAVKSPRVKRRFTDELHVQEIITTPIMPKSVHPEPDNAKTIGLPQIDTTDKSKRAATTSKMQENGNLSPRLMHRKRYTTFAGANKNKGGTPVQTMYQQQIPLKHSPKSSAQNSSQSTSSSRDGQKSTCSNPNSSTQPKHQFPPSSDNKCSLSDPSTKTELKSLQKVPKQTAKNVIIDIEHCGRISRNTGSDNFRKAFPSVSPPRYLARSNRKVVNIVYPPFNKTRSVTSHQYPSPRQAQSLSDDLDGRNILNITGEKAGYVCAGSHMTKTSIGGLPLSKEFKLTKDSTAEEKETLTNDTNKIVLPVIPLVQTKGGDT